MLYAQENDHDNVVNKMYTSQASTQTMLDTRNLLSTKQVELIGQPPS